jgi:hypothetical protein
VPPSSWVKYWDLFAGGGGGGARGSGSGSLADSVPVAADLLRAHDCSPDRAGRRSRSGGRSGGHAAAAPSFPLASRLVAVDGVKFWPHQTRVQRFAQMPTKRLRPGLRNASSTAIAAQAAAVAAAGVSASAAAVK